MKRILIGLLMFFTCMTAHAQTTVQSEENILKSMYESLLEEGLKLKIVEDETRSLGEGPNIRIEPSPEEWEKYRRTGFLDEEKLRLFGTTNITQTKGANVNPWAGETTNPMSSVRISTPELKVKKPFGNETTAAFINQTTDFATIIQALSNTDLLVEENIQLITTSEMTFERVLPKTQKNMVVTVLSFVRDGRMGNLDVVSEDDAIKLTGKTVLAPGLHTFNVKYLIQNGVSKSKNIAQIKYSLTGTNWPLPVERFSALVLLPQKTTFYQDKLLFGTNNIDIPEAYNKTVDDASNIYFQLKQPLPAFADVKIDLRMDSDVFYGDTFEEWLLSHLDWLTVIITATIMILYFILTALTIVYEKPAKNAINHWISFKPLFVHYAAFHKVKEKVLQELAMYYQNSRRKDRCVYYLAKPHGKIFERFVLKPGYNLLFYIQVMAKYLLLVTLLILTAFATARYYDVILGVGDILLLIGIALVGLYLVYKKVVLPRLKIDLHRFINTLLDKNLGFGLSEAALNALDKQLYPYALALEIEKEWTNNMKQYTISNNVKSVS